MKNFSKIFSLCVSLLLIISCSARALGKKTQDVKESCHDCVQGFYSWYVPHIRKSEFSFERALEIKKDSFSPELFALLKKDGEASAKSPDEIVGLDFDPFLNAQDIADRYVVGDVMSNGKSYLVDVYAVWKEQKDTQPSVVPELICTDGKWRFINFYYSKPDKPSKPDDDNLIGVLKSLQEKRQISHKSEH